MLGWIMSKIKENVKKTLSELLNVNLDEMATASLHIRDLDMDSLQMYELIVDLEEKYDIKLSDDAIDSLVTVDDLVNLVEELVSIK